MTVEHHLECSRGPSPAQDLDAISLFIEAALAALKQREHQIGVDGPLGGAMRRARASGVGAAVDVVVEAKRPRAAWAEPGDDAVPGANPNAPPEFKASGNPSPQPRCPPPHLPPHTSSGQPPPNSSSEDVWGMARSSALLSPHDDGENVVDGSSSLFLTDCLRLLHQGAWGGTAAVRGGSEGLAA